MQILADLGVNFGHYASQTLHAVIGLWLYNLDFYCFKIGTWNSPRGGGGGGKKETLPQTAVHICPPSIHPQIENRGG